MMKRARGRPTKPDNEKILTNGLRPDQQRWIEGAAKAQGIHFAFLLRQIVDWYIVTVSISNESAGATSKKKSRRKKGKVANGTKQRAGERLTRVSP